MDNISKWVGRMARCITSGSALALSAATLLATGACATHRDMGVSMIPGETSPDMQALAKRAQAGDKQAQLELGIRFEEGDGVPQDVGRAMKLYRKAAMDSGGMRIMYVPSPQGVRAQPMSAGAFRSGSTEAMQRLQAVRSSLQMRSSNGHKSSVQIEWYVFSIGGKGLNSCSIKFLGKFTFCKVVNRPESTFKTTLGHVAQTSDVYTGYEGGTVCGYGFCQGNDDVYIADFYRERKEVVVGYVYNGKSLFGYLIDQNNSGFDSPSQNRYDLFYLRECEQLSDDKFKSIISGVAKILNKERR